MVYFYKGKWETETKEPSSTRSSTITISSTILTVHPVDNSSENQNFDLKGTCIIPRVLQCK